MAFRSGGGNGIPAGEREAPDIWLLVHTHTLYTLEYAVATAAAAFLPALGLLYDRRQTIKEELRACDFRNAHICSQISSQGGENKYDLHRASSLFNSKGGEERRTESLSAVSHPLSLQGSAERCLPIPDLVNFVTALAYYLCLALLAAFTQPGDNLLAEPCRRGSGDLVRNGSLNLILPRRG